MEEIIKEIVSEYKKLDEVEAITLAGSKASGRNDQQSDIDLDLFITRPIPIDKRRNIALKFADQMEIGNEFFGSSDEYILRDFNIDIDICLFNLEDIINNLHSVMNEYHTSTGYTTCFVHNVVHAKLLYDRNGLLKQLQKEYHHRYPHQLKQNIINMNYPILRDAFSSYYHQVEKAINRNDLNSLNHRVTAFLASYYDIIFAINEMLHPGEKRLLSIIEHSCSIYPPDAQKQIEQLIRNIGINDEVVLKTMNELVDELEVLLKNQHLI